METFNLKNEYELIKKLAVKAGLAIMEIYKTDFTTKYKEDSSPLTEADLKANDIIVAGLKEFGNGYSILSEECKDDLSRLDNQWCWIVDPLDGTKEFLKKNDEFTVNIALAFKGEAVLGAVYVPVSDELYSAYKGHGAFLTVNGHSTKINVSNKTDDIRLMVSRSHLSDKEKTLIDKYNIKHTIPRGSSLKGCEIARGNAEVYYRFGLTSEWDTAAMQCIVEEAGGIFKQMDGSEMRYNRENVLNEKGFYILNSEENYLK